MLFKEQGAKLPSCSIPQLFPCLGAPALAPLSESVPVGVRVGEKLPWYPCQRDAMQGSFLVVNMSLPTWLFPAAPWNKYFGFENNKNKKKGLMETCSAKAAACKVGMTSTGGRLCSGPKARCGHAQDEPGQPCS